MVINDIIINKSAALETCLKRIAAEYSGTSSNLLNPTKLESITLNLQRACELCIDIAMHVVSVKKLGIPQNSRDSFEILAKEKLIEPELALAMKKMIGFRNVAIHQYQVLSLEVIQTIIETRMDDFRDFITAVRSA